MVSESDGNQAASGGITTVEGGPRLQSLRSLLGIRSGKQSKMGYVGLQERLRVFDHELGIFVDEVERSDPAHETFWVDDCERLVDAAETALEAGAVGEGWRYLHAAERARYRGLPAFERATEDGGTENPRIARRARTLLEQAREDLSENQRRAVEAMLSPDGDTGQGVPDVDALVEAHRIIHDRYEDTHLKRRYLQAQFNQLLILELATGLGFLLLAVLAENDLAGLVSPFAASPDVHTVGFAVFVVLAGIIGAAFFGMRSLRKEPLTTKFPQEIESLRVTGARGAIGGIAAGLFYFLIGTDFLAESFEAAPAYLVIGFVAGYSERMVPEAVDKVSTITGD